MSEIVTPGNTKTKIQITQRDREILRLCLEQKFLTFEHVESFFPESSTKNLTSRRVGILKDSGIIKILASNVLKRQYIMTLTSFGETVARQDYAIELDTNLKPQRSTLVHDSIVTSVRLKFGCLFPDSKWMPERAIKPMDLDYLPDGIVEMLCGERIAIEVENSIKWYARYHALMRKDWSELPFDKVLFVATSEKIATSIERCISSAPERPIFGVMRLSELLNNNPIFSDKKRHSWRLESREVA